MFATHGRTAERRKDHEYKACVLYSTICLENGKLELDIIQIYWVNQNVYRKGGKQSYFHFHSHISVF